MQDFMAAYLEDWMDTIEALPCELQRNFSLIRELDCMSQDLVKNVQDSVQTFVADAKECSGGERREMLRQLTRAFQSALKHGEDKVNLAVQTYDLIDRHIRRLDTDLIKFEDELTMTGPFYSNNNNNNSSASTAAASTAASAAASNNILFQQQQQQSGVVDLKSFKKDAAIAGVQASTSSNSIAVAATGSGGNKKRKTGTGTASSTSGTPTGRLSRRSSIPPLPPTSVSAADDSSLPVPVSGVAGSRKVNLGAGRKRGAVDLSDEDEFTSAANGAVVDPNEPTYCICNNVSYGAMIACDNADCDIEWFHYECVGLDSPPKGKWYCDACREKLDLN